MTKHNKKNQQEFPKKRGRPRVNLEFKEARELVRNENISSIAQYKKWWALNTPAKIPKRPDRAYKHEWEGWNDFLGSNNPFPCVRKVVRPFIEAKTFAHQLGFKTKTQWLNYAKSGNKPEDIPSRPDLLYRDDWFTWADFLGANIASVKRNMEEAEAIFFIIQRPGRPNNIYQLGVTIEGKSAIRDAQIREQFKIISLFYCDMTFNWQSIVRGCGKPYWDGGRKDEFFIPNIGEFIFDIGDFTVPIKIR